jgi:hypothetical protein
MSTIEIADCQAKGLCFKCDEKFKSGHKEESKRLFMIMVLEDHNVDYNGHFTQPT